MEGPPIDKRAVFAWCLYNWGNHSFLAVITTFVFATYFTQAVAPDPVTGTTWWGQAQAIAGLTIAIASPPLGSVADLTGRRKLWLAVMSVAAIAATGALWFVTPSPDSAQMALVLVATGTVALEIAFVFYNALLPDIAPRDHLGRISGWGWASGYLGGIACLLILLVGFIQVDIPPFGLSKATAEHVRISGPFSALWFAVFAWPLFYWVRERKGPRMPIGAAISRGLGDLVSTIRTLWSTERHIIWFLLAQMIYLDGLTTLFAFGGIYAAGTFGMSMADVILFGVAINVTAAAGAMLFAWIDDWIGPRRTIAVSLAALIGLSIAVLLIDSKTWFWILGLSLGVFLGPAQSASRSLMARVAPVSHRTQMFGLSALSSRVTAFTGPAALAWATAAAGSQRAGMATIVVFFVVGLVLLLTKVPEAVVAMGSATAESRAT